MKSWYLIYSKPKGEKIAQSHLERQKYVTYLPCVLNKIRRHGQIKELIDPMFPRYLFINLNDQTDDWGPIRSTKGVSKLVRFGVSPAKVPDKFIKYLKDSENNNGYHELPEKPIKIGDQVSILEGPFEGYSATLFSRNSKDRVVLLLKISENYIKVHLKHSNIEHIT